MTFTAGVESFERGALQQLASDNAVDFGCVADMCTLKCTSIVALEFACIFMYIH